MHNEPIIQGRRVSWEHLLEIRTLLTEETSWHRTRLSRELCPRWGWHNEADRLNPLSLPPSFFKMRTAGCVSATRSVSRRTLDPFVEPEPVPQQTKWSKIATFIYISFLFGSLLVL